MEGTNEDHDMPSSACSAGSRLLLREGDLTYQGLLVGVWSWRSGGEMLSMDSYRAGLRGTAGLSG